MSSILTGKHIQVSVFGQSHSKAIGAVIDGLPAGVKIDSEKSPRLCAAAHRATRNIRPNVAKRTSPLCFPALWTA